MNFTPDAMKQAQQQMSGMSTDDMMRQMQNMTPAQKAQMQSMGIDPSMLDMMSKNPDMMNMAKQQMGSVTPEEAANMAQNQVRNNSYGSQATDLKKAGNACFSRQDYKAAILKYEEALMELEQLDISDKPPLREVQQSCHLNLAACFLKSGDFKRVSSECGIVLQNGPNKKAYYRRGQAQAGLGNLKEAFKDINDALKLDPNDKDVEKHHGELKARIEEIAEEESEDDSDGPPPLESEDKVQEVSPPRKKAAKPTAKATTADAASSGPAASSQEVSSSFSIKQLRLLLVAKMIDYSGVVEKCDLVSLVCENYEGASVEDMKNIAKVTATLEKSKANEPNPFNMNPEQLKKQADVYADQMKNVNPDQLKMQANMMKGMSPDQVRAAMPQTAHMDDAQIKQCITQMEMMASNPSMMQAATDQMKNMSPEQMKQLNEQFGGGTSSSSSKSSQSSLASGVPVATGSMEEQMKKAQEMMGSMSSDQRNSMMKQQMDMMKTNPDMMKNMMRSNPATAGMTDAQLDAQMDMLKNMDQDQLKQSMDMLSNNDTMKEMMKNMGGGGAAAAAAAAGDAAAPTLPGGMQMPKMGADGMPDMGSMQDMVKNMDPKQMASMMKMQREMMKNNPDMLKNMMSSNPMFKNMDPSMLEKQMDAMGNMSDDQLESMMKQAQRIQQALGPCMNAYQYIDRVSGGHAKSIMLVLLAVLLFYIVDYFFL